MSDVKQTIRECAANYQWPKLRDIADSLADENAQLQSKLDSAHEVIRLVGEERDAAREQRDNAGKLSEGLEADVTDLKCEVNDLRGRLGRALRFIEKVSNIPSLDEWRAAYFLRREAGGLLLDMKGEPSSTADEQAHPEDDCDACGGRNITWSAPSAIWNAVMGSPNGIVCPQCFDRRAAAHGFVGLWRFEAGREPVDSAGEGQDSMALCSICGTPASEHVQSGPYRVCPGTEAPVTIGVDMAAPDSDRSVINCRYCGYVTLPHKCPLAT